MKVTIRSKTLIIFLLIAKMAWSQGIDKPRYQIITHRAGSYLGTFNIELFPLIAPLAVHNFDSLVGAQFFDSTAFHRVVPGFVIQGGDPNTINGPVSTWGQGQPWQPTVPAEFSVVRHVRGILGAARDVDTNSANSQFYICVANATFLDGQYTVYGRVTSGMEVVDTIVNSPRDPNDVPLQKIEMFVSYIGVNDTIPNAPSLTSPANNAQAVSNVQLFQWSSVPGTALYTIEISTDSLFSNFFTKRNAGLSSVSINGFSGSTTYYWRVKSNNGGHESPYSVTYKFSTQVAGPVLVTPVDSAVNVFLNPVFNWERAPLADNYTLQVSTTSIFLGGTLAFNQSGLTDTTQQVTGLLPNTLYYWRVRSAIGTQQGFYSTKYSFTTGTSVAIGHNGEGKNGFSILNAFPNPTKETLTVQLSINRSSIIEISIFDIAGKEVTRTEQAALDKELTINIDCTELKSGNYFLKLKTGEVEKTVEFKKD